MSERLLRGQEVAIRLDISLATAYRWMKAGVVPVVRIPGVRSIRVPESALARWIKRNTSHKSGAAGESGRMVAGKHAR